MRIKMRHFNKYVFNRVGLDVNFLSQSVSIVSLVKHLQQKKIDISVIFDIGAHEGYWTKNMKRWVKLDTTFFLFEPNILHNPKLDASGSTYFNYLLGENDGEQMPFFAVGNTGDSYYKEINPVYDEITPKVMKVKTLDSLILENQLPQPDFIKLDTQGSELDIVKGASKTLKATKVLIAELPISVLNPGSPGIQEFLDFMENSGFTPIAITEVHRLLDVLIQIDVAFLKNEIFTEIYGHRNPYFKFP